MITASQIRAARHLLGLSQADVAGRTGLSLPTIKRAESDRAVSLSRDAIKSICAVLEAAGAEFIVGRRPGVRLAERRSGTLFVSAEGVQKRVRL